MPILSAPRSFTFIESDWKLATIGGLLARYGVSNFWSLRSHGAKLIEAFEKIYEAQDQKRAFLEPRSLLAVAGMDDLSSRSCEELMTEMMGGDADALISRELLGGLMMNNYGRDWRKANALCCATAVAPLAAGGSAAAWSVVEGNDQLAVNAFQEAGAGVRLARRVVKVSRSREGPREYIVRHVDATCSHKVVERCDLQEQRFDFVAIAAPQKGGGIAIDSKFARRKKSASCASDFVGLR